jgi:hypothetical protein
MRNSRLILSQLGNAMGRIFSTIVVTVAALLWSTFLIAAVLYLYGIIHAL